MPSAVLRMMFRSLRFAAIAPFRHHGTPNHGPRQVGLMGS